MNKNVYVYADEPVVALWDGKEYELGSEPVEVAIGVAEHWQEAYEGIRIDDVPTEVIEQRKPENPLEEANRGTAFTDLKKKKKTDKNEG